MKIAILAQIASLPLLCASEFADINQSRGTSQMSIPRPTQPDRVVSLSNPYPNSFVIPVARGRGPGSRGSRRHGAGLAGPTHGRPGGFHGRRHRR